MQFQFVNDLQQLIMDIFDLTVPKHGNLSPICALIYNLYFIGYLAVGLILVACYIGFVGVLHFLSYYGFYYFMLKRDGMDLCTVYI